MKDRCRDRGKYRFTGNRYNRKGTTEERDNRGKGQTQGQKRTEDRYSGRQRDR